MTIDVILGRIICHLKANGSYEQTTIIVTSDHGQSLGDDNFVGHRYMLNDAIVSASIIVKTPHNKRGHKQERVSTAAIHELITNGVDEGRWTIPHTPYVFSEAFGLNRSSWENYVGELSTIHNPHIRKRIWNQDGSSLTVNGTT